MSIDILARRTPPQLWPVGALAVASLLVLTSAPVVLRSLIALPLLVLVPGFGLSRLVVRARRQEDVDLFAAATTVLQLAMPVLLGVLVLLSDALLLNLLRLELSARALVLGDVVLSLMLLAAGFIPALRPAMVAPLRVPWRIAAGAVVTLGLLIGAVAVARAVQPPPVRTPYLAVQLQSPDLVATPGDSVSLAWRVTGFDGAATDAAAVLTMGGSTPKALQLQQGFARFTAPATVGVYRVEVRVGTGSAVTALLTVRAR